MKKIAIFTFLFSILFLCKTVNAQEDENNLKNFRFGLHAIPAIAWYKPDVVKSFSSSGSQLKFAYGLATEFRLNKVASFATGINISYSGGGLNFLDDSVHYEVVTDSKTDIFYIKERIFNTIYADIPITLKMKTPEIGAMTYFGQFGVNMGIRTKARATDKVIVNNPSGPEVTQDNVDITKDISFVQLGLNVGLGAEYNLAGSTSLVFSVNYHNGFTNITQKESDYLKDKKGNPLKLDNQSNYFSVTVGVLF